MRVVRLGCLEAALLVAATVSSSAVAEIPPNAAKWPTGEGRGLRSQGLTGVTHDWEIPDLPLSLDAGIPKITVGIPTEFKIDIDLTIHPADAASGERGERFRRVKATPGSSGRHDGRHLRCRSGINQPGRHP
jgi:hypothetical protein